MAVTPTALRQDLFRILDEVLETGVPVEVRRGDRLLRIVPVDPPGHLSRLVKRDAGTDAPLLLAEVRWEAAWAPDDG